MPNNATDNCSGEASDNTTPGSTINRNAGVIDLTCLEEDPGYSEDEREIWVQIGRTRLYWNHQHILLKGEWLWDTHLNAV